jgi:hypothetical protein
MCANTPSCLLSTARLMSMTFQSVKGMKTKCDYCGWGFGLTRRRWLNYQFCKRKCELAWRAKREETVALRRWLYSSPRTSADVKTRS